jgi:thiamine-phosphate diphosphorylase
MGRPLGDPIICLVTDRRRVATASDDALLQLIADAIAVGVTMIQIRERDLDDRRLFDLTTRAVAAAGTTPVVVNDRTDVAVAANAAGVHLRSDSMAADRVRTIAPGGFVIGRSVHSVAEARVVAETGVDYLVMGTIFSTTSKDAGLPLSGIAGLEAVTRAMTTPVLAIGGITLDNARQAARAGAAGIAAITLFTAAWSGATAARRRSLEAVVEGIKEAFH